MTSLRRASRAAKKTKQTKAIVVGHQKLWAGVLGLCCAGCVATSSSTVSTRDQEQQSQAQTQTPASPAGLAQPAEPEAAAAGPSLELEGLDPQIAALIELGSSDNQVDAHLLHLTENIGPRLTSSHGLMAAEQWSLQQFRAWGLQAQLEKWGDAPVGFDRGPAWGRHWSSDAEFEALEFTTPAWTPGLLGPHRAQLIDYPKSRKALKQIAGHARDRYVLIRELADQGPEFRASAYFQTLLKWGVAGFIAPAGAPDDPLVHTDGDHQIEWSQLPDYVWVSLRGDQHARLAQALDAGQSPELEFSIDNRMFRGPVPQHNVIADIPGSTWPEQFVIVSGHLDSWDGASGAVDNGTGVATTMEAARLLMATGARPQRTIRFALWGGEEQGLFGSSAYVQAHEHEMSAISAVFVHDQGTNYLSGLSITPEMLPQMASATQAVQRFAGEMSFSLELVDSLRSGPSDHAPFIAAGVPAFMWQQSGRSNYERMHHTQFDRIDAVIPEYQRHSSLVTAIAALELANAQAPLNRTNSSPLPRRTMGAALAGTMFTRIFEGSRAQALGWKVGDRVLSVAGTPVENGSQIVELLQKAPPKLRIVLLRGTREIRFDVDFSNDPGERARAQRREQWPQRLQAAGLDPADHPLP